MKMVGLERVFFLLKHLKYGILIVVCIIKCYAKINRKVKVKYLTIKRIFFISIKNFKHTP